MGGDKSGCVNVEGVSPFHLPGSPPTTTSLRPLAQLTEGYNKLHIFEDLRTAKLNPPGLRQQQTILKRLTLEFVLNLFSGTGGKVLLEYKNFPNAVPHGLYRKEIDCGAETMTKLGFIVGSRYGLEFPTTATPRGVHIFTGRMDDPLG